MKKIIVTTFVLSIALTTSSFINPKNLNKNLIENFANSRFSGNWSSE